MDHQITTITVIIALVVITGSALALGLARAAAREPSVREPSIGQLAAAADLEELELLAPAAVPDDLPSHEQALLALLPLERQRLAWTDFAGHGYDSEESEPLHMDSPVGMANLVTSLAADIRTDMSNAHLGEPTHRLVLDIDHPVHVVPSTTPGHFHLYIDHPIKATAYWKLVAAMVDAGLVEPGYLGASERRGFTCVRPPWVRKEDVPYVDSVTA